MNRAIGTWLIISWVDGGKPPPLQQELAFARTTSSLDVQSHTVTAKIRSPSRYAGLPPRDFDVFGGADGR